KMFVVIIKRVAVHSIYQCGLHSAALVGASQITGLRQAALGLGLFAHQHRHVFPTSGNDTAEPVKNTMSRNRDYIVGQVLIAQASGVGSYIRGNTCIATE